MAKTTKKSKAEQPPARVGRPRTRDVKDKSREARATTSASSSTTKPSQKHRLAVKRAAAAKKKSQEREQESQDVRSGRRVKDASRKSEARSEESAVAAKRRRLDATRKRKTRLEETEEEHKKRTSSNKERTSRARSEETEDQHHRRTSSNAAKTSRARSEETEDQHHRRTTSNAARTSRARSVETETDTSRRRAQNKQHMALTRAAESFEVSEFRKEADRKRHHSHVTGDCGIARKDVRVEENYLGIMSVQCSSCGALHYKGEQPQSKKFNTCCRHGLIQLPLFDNFPKELRDLFTSSTSESAEFLKNIRSYNNSLAMGSMVAHVDTPKGGGPYTYRLHGQVFHVTGALHPEPGQEHLCAQVFILDTEEAAAELANRKTKVSCSKELYKKLIDLLHMYNPFVKSYKMMREKEEEEELLATAENRDVREVKMVFRSNKNLNPNRYQLPTAEEIAVVFVGDEDENPGKRAITVYQRSTGTFQYLLDTDKETDPLCYPLLFVDGKYGWHVHQQRQDGHGGTTKMSAREFYSYYLHIRPNFSPLHYAKKLFQQFCVDVWTKIEQDRLNFIRQHQDQLRVESVQGLMDHINAEDDGPCGQRIFLPNTFTGSPRHFVSLYQDALAVVSRFGKPDLFLTMTCNPSWKEIQEALLPGQEAVDRPDVVSRVFKLKLEELKKDLFTKNIFGEVAAWIYVIEFQKRGLPHLHLLMILKNQWKPRMASEIDDIVSAELPDPDEDPELFEIVSSVQMHRPCGIHNPDSSCMVGDACSKHFPKDFRERTSVENDGFPMYRRRDDGRTVSFKTKNSGVVKLDNRSVVPYNKYISRKFRSHANLEICGNVGAVKYLYKYLYKGTTRSAIHIYTDKSGVEHRTENEVNSYLDTRYVCAPESLWHIFDFRMSDRSTPVMQLKVHLKNAQGVVYKEGEERDAAQRGQLRDTTLTAWFAANQRFYDELESTGMIPEDVVDCRGIYYVEMPEHFQFSKGKWALRKNATRSIGRMHFVSPRDQERFALRVMLLNVTDAKSYEDLQTVDGVFYEKFVDAARAAGYLTEDIFYEKSLEEAASFHSAPQLRGFFVTLLMFGEIHNAEELWYRFVDDFSEDFVYKHFPKEKAKALAYNDLIDRMNAMGEKLDKWMSLEYERIIPDDVIDFDYCSKEGDRMRSTLVAEQEEVVKAVLDAVKSGGGLIYVDGPGGSGKTYVYLTLINILQGMHLKVIPIAWIGIAASLLPHGRTVASFFHLNIKDGCKTSTIHLQSAEAKQLAALDVVLWDEAPMSPKASLETVDQLFRDVTKIDKPFGGKVIILGGDFRQCLPVVDRKGRDEQISNSIKKSHLWPLFQVHHLKTNMRAQNADEEWKRKEKKGLESWKFRKNSDAMEIWPRKSLDHYFEMDLMFRKSPKLPFSLQPTNKPFK
ncbi:hypothetical protein B9Z55_002756 [Caenorhabditis nigoni]|uniref:ATP-dependent DNA helicase n=2 Tax=Caenorhabditis nigoni TaxID=1611254 RepID=A0A2G5VLZ7_9PELO|nr:hypothetical protein B9Z55_002756 [Caenorhabditis nigoni]